MGVYPLFPVLHGRGHKNVNTSIIDLFLRPASSHLVRLIHMIIMMMNIMIKMIIIMIYTVDVKQIWSNWRIWWCQWEKVVIMMIKWRSKCWIYDSDDHNVEYDDVNDDYKGWAEEGADGERGVISGWGARHDSWSLVITIGMSMLIRIMVKMSMMKMIVVKMSMGIMKLICYDSWSWCTQCRISHGGKSMS